MATKEHGPLQFAYNPYPEDAEMFEPAELSDEEIKEFEDSARFTEDMWDAIRSQVHAEKGLPPGKSLEEIVNTPKLSIVRGGEEYDREAFFAKVLAMAKQRSVQYNDTRVSGHQALGQMFTALLELHYGMELPWTLPGSMAVLFIDCMKNTRAAGLPPGVVNEDDWYDKSNYASIGHQNALYERDRASENGNKESP